MKEKRILGYLIAILSLCLLITACAKRGDQEESQPTAETSPSTSRTQVTAKETEPSPLETETEPSETQESDPSQSAQPDPSIEATTQVTSTSSTASTMTLPSYTVTTTEGASFTFPSLTWTNPPRDLYEEYERIYNDYSDRLKQATPRLINEYKTEIKTNTDIDSVKAQKISALSTILGEGTAKMEKLAQDKDGNLLELGEWEVKLGAVYAQELLKLNQGFN